MEKIKQFINSKKGKDISTVIIVILVGLGSFGLGRLSKNVLNTGIKIEYPNRAINQTASNAISAIEPMRTPTISQIMENSGGKNYFASNRGSKYYSLGCSAGKSIVQENRIYFASAEEAEKAGYEPSVSCN
ncbi:hypothetical protein A3A01_01145 [Candidatus Nomurabacteria bacterium RIFCSPLOWO2_01_FULL_39_17]|uniref:Ada DNA repair metal-binding domain-containing protein n=1 Tax=Candidatus Nomurabacteria bacterium RIFCSPLOWO2_01_FULL_39_17 TaxID=1801770 RepID=A0A1F6WVH0_9BACT|nr:MAG: hypothetical protein A3A01_01145 [Candidatus Nomurabacteria bacterium RIFCSPLOWO2_01_FULL_39_17]